MAVRGTENYVYYTDNTLGAGSTATVFFARHKRRGEACAIKVFTNPSSQRRVGVQQNELDYMKKLDHKNIVKCLAIEKDTRSDETALVMELCSEGSVQKMLSDPQYVYGLDEQLYYDFITQFASGLHYLRLHGVGHRDIKPGNILCCKEENGQVTFKLTDFGASRELLLEGTTRTALYGTEEYLPVSDDYESCGELWSIGVTMYQIACGQLPFQPFGGRNNKHIMHQITSNKQTGVISGVQRRQDGEVEWSNTLPPFCSLSQGLQEYILPMMAGLMEKDRQKQWQFEQFFPSCETLTLSVVVVVFNVSTCKYHRCYLPRDSRYHDLLVGLARQTSFPLNELLLIYNSKELLDLITDSDTLSKYPLTSETNPIMLTIRNKSAQDIVSRLTLLPTAPACESSDKNVEANWARDASAYSYRAMFVVQHLIMSQLCLKNCRQFLLAITKARLDYASEQFKEICVFFPVVQVNIDLLSQRTASTVNALRTSLKKQRDNKLRLFRQSLPPADEREFANAGGTITAIQAAYETLLNQLQAQFERVQKLKSHIEAKIKKELSRQPQQEPVVSACEEQRCLHRLKILYEKSRDVHRQFQTDKKERLTYNQDQLHKFEKVKQEDRLKAVTATVRDHCVPTTIQRAKQYNEFYNGIYSEHDRVVQHIVQDVNKFNEEVQRLNAEISQAGKVCEDDIKLSTTSDIVHAVLSRIDPIQSSGGLAPAMGASASVSSVSEHSVKSFQDAHGMKSLMGMPVAAVSVKGKDIAKNILTQLQGSHRVIDDMNGCVSSNESKLTRLVCFPQRQAITQRH